MRERGAAQGPLRRMTRGPFPLGYLTVTNDFRTLAYFSYRRGGGDIFLRDLRTGAERVLTDGPAGEKGYPAISPSGALLAYGTRPPGGGRAVRPLFVASLRDGTWRKLSDDCGGRPREWVDERRLILERFRAPELDRALRYGNRRSAGAADERRTVRHQSTVVAGSTMDRVRCLASGRTGQCVCCRVRSEQQPIPEAEWVLVDRAASHPFWSADGRLLYYTPTGTNPLIRSVDSRAAVRHRDPPGGRRTDRGLRVQRNADARVPSGDRANRHARSRSSSCSATSEATSG